MKDIWRKIWELLRDFPVLWMPCLYVNLLAICLWQLRGIAEKGIFQLFSMSRSVLDGATAEPGLDHATLANASTVFTTVEIATEFTILCLFVAAFMVTAKMVEAIGCGQAPDMRAAWTKVVPYWRRILIFSAKFVAVCIVLTVAAVVLAIVLLAAIHHPEFLKSTAFNNMTMITVACCLMLVLTPAAIRILQADKETRVPKESRKCAMVFTVGATKAGMTKFLAVCLVLAIAVVVLAIVLLRTMHHPEFLKSTAIINLATITVACSLMLVLRPAAIRLLQADKWARIPKESIRCAMVFAVGATEAGILLGMFVQRLEAGMAVGHKWEHSALWSLESTVSNMLNVPVFIALALIALQSNNNANEQIVPDSLSLPLNAPLE